jgi:hypothetical protein
VFNPLPFTPAVVPPLKTVALVPPVPRAPIVVCPDVEALVEGVETAGDVDGCTDALEVAAGEDVVTGAECEGDAGAVCGAAGADECEEPREPPDEWPPPKPPPPVCPPPPPPCPPRCANAEGANTNTAAAKAPTKIFVMAKRAGVERVMFAPRDACRELRLSDSTTLDAAPHRMVATDDCCDCWIQIDHWFGKPTDRELQRFGRQKWQRNPIFMVARS